MQYHQLHKLKNLDLDRLTRILNNAPFEALVWNEQQGLYAPCADAQMLSDPAQHWISLSLIELLVSACGLRERQYHGDTAQIRERIGALETATDAYARHERDLLQQYCLMLDQVDALSA